jgi:NADPH2:quinone reductase
MIQMKAIVFDPPGLATANPLLRDVPQPEPQAGDVLIRVHRAGLNFADLMMRQGVYPHPKGYPLVAGLELSGVVEACGEGVTDFAPGDRVAAFSENAGGFAAFCAVPEERLVRLPDGMSFDTAAAFYIQSLTAWHLLHTVSTTRPGDTLLIHAIGGGVGLQLTQLAKMAGAVVIGTVGTAGKEAQALAFGADRVVNRGGEDFISVCNEMTDGRGVDKVIDSTGATILDRSFDCIRRLGHVVSYGEAEGKPLPNLWERLVQKSLTFTRLHIGHLDNRGDAWRQGIDAVVAAIMAGRLQVPIAGSYRLEEAGAMFAALESRQIAGKLILRVAD